MPSVTREVALFPALCQQADPVGGARGRCRQKAALTLVFLLFRQSRRASAASELRFCRPPEEKTKRQSVCVCVYVCWGDACPGLATQVLYRIPKRTRPCILVFRRRR